MPEIAYKDLRPDGGDQIRLTGEKLSLPVYLIFGEDLLVKQVFDSLIGSLLPDHRRGLNYEPIDGGSETVADVIERISTYSLVAGVKVVALRDSRIFYGKQDKEKMLEHARKAMANQDAAAAARHLLVLMGHLGLKPDDVNPAEPHQSFGGMLNGEKDEQWLSEVIQHCRENRLLPPAASDDAALLQQSIRKGFPAHNVLIITTDVVDKRRGLYGTIRDTGLIVDCSVPKGDRKADRLAQTEVLTGQCDAILQRCRKTIAPGVFEALCAKTGFDLRTFTNNLDKLINYIGERSEITTGDVESVLERTKTDPIYELTNAVSERNLAQALFFLQSLLGADIHPLQALGAIANQIRRLAIARDFIDSDFGRPWDARAPYHQFQKTVMPAVVAFDRHLEEQIDQWPTEVTGSSGAETKTSPKARKKPLDVRLARNPKNAYPIYLLLKNADRFTKEELHAALQEAYRADQQMKTSPMQPKLIIERILFRLCGHGSDV